MSLSLLFVDDEIKVSKKLVDILASEGYEIDICYDGDMAIKKLSEKSYDIMLTDLNMPIVDGFELIEYVNKNGIDVITIIFSGYASVEGAIKALKLGAYDYIQKPVPPEALKYAIERAANHLTLKRQNKEYLESLKKLNKLKDEFLTVVSHDLRSPLSSISGYVKYLLKKGNLTNSQVRYLNVIQDISEHLYDLVNELLDVSKIEQGVIDLNKEDLDISEIINTSINGLLLLGVDKNNKIKYHNSVKNSIVSIDKMKTLQVLNNLINNAIKFTEDGEINIHLDEHSETHIRVTITDTGIGMTDEEVNNIFNQYGYNFKHGTRGEKGNGLGLVICKKFIDLHKGEIAVYSTPQEGTTVEIILPKE